VLVPAQNKESRIISFQENVVLRLLNYCIKSVEQHEQIYLISSLNKTNSN